MTELEINVKPVTISLILICIILFFFSSLFPSIIDLLSISADNFSVNPLVIITAAFLHRGWAHLLFNLFALFFFGTALESESGSKFMVLLFIASVTIANFAFMFLFPDSSAVGISGFVYGLIGSLVIIKPKLRILMPLGFISIPMPVLVAGPLIALGEFILSAANLYNIAHVAHFGGFIAGFAFGLIERFKKRKRVK